jgi:CubicO group peptidase (beta-lactamase class C family)
MKLKMISLAFVLTMAVTCLAQDAATVAKVDKYISLEQRLGRIPGVSLAVVKDGHVVLAKGYGLANVEHQVSVKPETIFQSGSVGKQFTATAIMMLVEDGKLKLEDKINQYFTDAPAAWQNITIRHLLSHTSGTTDYPNDFDFRKDYTEDEMLKRAEAIPLAFQPGEKWSYSNMGYVVLGILIHKVSGKFYGDFLQERIFRPLGMTTARIISEADIVPNRSGGYVLVKGDLKNQNWVSPTLNTTADGALYLTVYDMAKWDAALYGEKLLKKTSLEQMWTPVKLNNGKTEGYGFGWSIADVRKHRLIEHGGSWQGFKSHIARYTDDKFTVIVFANLAQANPTRMAHNIAAIFNRDLAPIPQPVIEDKEPDVTTLAKKVWQQLMDGSLESGLFTSDAWDDVKVNSPTVREVIASHGSLKSLELLDRIEQGGRRIYRYRLAFEDLTLIYTLILTKEGRMAGLRIQPQ